MLAKFPELWREALGSLRAPVAAPAGWAPAPSLRAFLSFLLFEVCSNYGFLLRRIIW